MLPRAASHSSSDGSRPPRALHRGQPYAAGCRVDQYAVAGPAAGPALQGEGRGHEGDRERGGDFVRERARLAYHELRVGERMCPQAVEGDRYDFIPGREL